MGTTPHDRRDQVVDLTGNAPLANAGVDPALRAEVHRLAEEVEFATARLAPLLEEALVRLTEVDALVCDFTASSATDPQSADAAYEFASGVSGHARLFDALQTLSSGADAYLATASNHPTGAAA